tara:strand:- start:2068 stop:2331 length:264 start_codon:yes stop_codon:yes gene_type:complete
MNIDIFVEQWMGPESLDYYYIDWVVKEVKRLQKEVDLLSIDVCESLELILDAHHPEVKDSVMSMFGDAIGDNWPYYGTPLPNKEMIE